MAKYAPGGDMDRLNRPNYNYDLYINKPEKHSGGAGKAILIILIILAGILFLSPGLSSEPITISNSTIIDCGDGVNAIIYCTITNNTIGYILHPSYTITATDESGTQVLSQTDEISNLLRPKETKALTITVPEYTGCNYKIEVHSKTIKTY